MENGLVGRIGAAFVATLGSTQVAAAAPDPRELFQAKSFAELLQPIPNATVVLAAAEMASVADYKPTAADGDMVAQYHHHHHHHHHHWRRVVPPWHRRHHHHHHHNHHHHHHHY